jgi:hypothetical protein
VGTSTKKEFDMNDHFLNQLARERHAGFLREAEMNRKPRKVKTGRPIATRWKLSIVTALGIVIIILQEFLG